MSGNPQVLSICLDDAVNDRGLAMTSSFSNMVVFGQCLAHWDEIERYEHVLSQLIHAGKSFLPIAADSAARLAKGPYTKACFVGSGPLRAVAKESALKLLELTAGKVLTMSESALGLRHGPMAALDQNTLFVCFLSGNKRVQEYERNLLDEIGSKRLVTTRVVVAGSEVPAISSLAEHHVAPAGSFTVADDYRARGGRNLRASARFVFFAAIESAARLSKSKRRHQPCGTKCKHPFLTEVPPHPDL